MVSPQEVFWGRAEGGAAIPGRTLNKKPENVDRTKGIVSSKRGERGRQREKQAARDSGRRKGHNQQNRTKSTGERGGKGSCFKDKKMKISVSEKTTRKSDQDVIGERG